jgi:hypothetical protein
MKVKRAIAIPALAAGALMAIAPSAMASTSASSASSAISTTSAIPAAAYWYSQYSYATKVACNQAGYSLWLNHKVLTYRCVEIELDGYTTAFLLQYQLGIPPGS